MYSSSHPIARDDRDFLKAAKAAPDGRFRLLQCGKGTHDFEA
jgi:hypothetical protein